MSAPSVLRIIGTAQNDIVAYGDIFNHAIRPDHPGLTENELSDLPKKLSDPLMVLKNGQNYVFAIDVKTQTGATVVVPIKINEQKKAPNGKSILVINRIASVYPKTQSKTNAQADYNWFNNSIAKNQLVYINKKRSTHWLAGLGHLKPSSGHASLHASIMNIINNPPQNVKTENDLKNYRNTHMPLYQTAWHGSPYDFEHFDLGAMGSGEGRQVHGWGLYFAKDRNISESYKDFLKNLRSTVVIDGKKYTGYKNGFRDEDGNRPSDKKLRFALLNLSLEGSREKAIQKFSELAHTSKGTGFEEDYAGALKILKDSKAASVERPEAKLYEVDIPDNDVLLDEDKFLKDQPKAVKKAIADYYRSRPDSYATPKDDNLTGSTTTGEGFYKDVVFQMKREGSTNPKRDASLLLNSLGIKGVTYEGNKDGRCFVVFDDKAISIIDKYNQEQAQIQGQTTVTGDMISLFDAADQSTFMHESAHWYLINMQKLALNENASRQFVEDFMTLQQWFGNKKLDGVGQ